jgi:hypothetical protein
LFPLLTCLQPGVLNRKQKLEVLRLLMAFGVPPGLNFSSASTAPAAQENATGAAAARAVVKTESQTTAPVKAEAEQQQQGPEPMQVDAHAAVKSEQEGVAANGNTSGAQEPAASGLAAATPAVKQEEGAQQGAAKQKQRRYESLGAAAAAAMASILPGLGLDEGPLLEAVAALPPAAAWAGGWVGAGASILSLPCSTTCTWLVKPGSYSWSKQGMIDMALASYFNELGLFPSVEHAMSSIASRHHHP